MILRVRCLCRAEVHSSYVPTRSFKELGVSYSDRKEDLACVQSTLRVYGGIGSAPPTWMGRDLYFFAVVSKMSFLGNWLKTLVLHRVSLGCVLQLTKDLDAKLRLH